MNNLRPCGNCTMCCKLLPIKETDSAPGKWCRFCDPGVGCEIYDNRPESCRSYLCAWVQMDSVKPDLRPDKCKVIFEKIEKDVMLIICEPYIKFNRLVRGQIIDFFKNQKYSVVINQIGRNPKVIPAKGRDPKAILNNCLARAKKIK